MRFIKTHIFLIVFSLFLLQATGPVFGQETVKPKSYLDVVKTELQKKWPNNKILNLVFHGHSVPHGLPYQGSLENSGIPTPYETLKLIKKEYPFAMVNVIVTSIEAQQLLYSLKKYMTDDQFDPKVEVPIEEIQSLFK